LQTKKTKKMATLTKKEFLTKKMRIVSVNTLQPITFEGSARDCFRARKNLLKENPHLIFKMYEKVTVNA